MCLRFPYLIGNNSINAGVGSVHRELLFHCLFFSLLFFFFLYVNNYVGTIQKTYCGKLDFDPHSNIE